MTVPDQPPVEPVGPVVLVGPPGADTAQVGGEVALRLGVPLHDTDRMVEARLGADVTEIFVEQGEAVFRVAEREVALTALEPGALDGVLVLGGGAVLDPPVARALRGLPGVRVVFLDVTITDAARRLGLNAERPTGIGAPRSQWLRMMEQRRPRYRAVADVVVATDGLDTAGIAERVLTALADPLNTSGPAQGVR